MFTLRWLPQEDWAGAPGHRTALVVTANDGTLGTAMLAMSILTGTKMELLALCRPQVVSVDRGYKLNGIAMILVDETRRDELQQVVARLLGANEHIDSP